ncbi:hypothetical protein [Nocardia camponoti]|uniref:Uncharacterized protein n=1 Tax=Nocardia camponoti TaxID=1616106 RepID=A0A917QUU0_9NOCA|nr:hypothetical protein [Nocardia camponoti]GGK68870.1 hypothetical protein GCM10011591_46240 [Nocardia camponoti]
MTEPASPTHDIMNRACAIHLAHLTGDEAAVTRLLVECHELHGLQGVSEAMRWIDILDEVIDEVVSAGMDPRKVSFTVTPVAASS